MGQGLILGYIIVVIAASSGEEIYFVFMQTVDKTPVVFTVAAINKGAVQQAKLTQH